jgi:hypothetical protein
MSRMLTALPAFGSFGFTGAWVGRSPSRLVTSADLMFPCSRVYADAAPATPKARTAVTTSATPRSA